MPRCAMSSFQPLRSSRVKIALLALTRNCRLGTRSAASISICTDATRSPLRAASTPRLLSSTISRPTLASIDWPASSLPVLAKTPWIWAIMPRSSWFSAATLLRISLARSSSPEVRQACARSTAIFCDKALALGSSPMSACSASAFSSAALALAGSPCWLQHRLSMTRAASSPCLLPRHSRRSSCVIMRAPSVWPRSSITRVRFV